jgi:xanthine dehydrogenase accessory factor
MWWDMARNWAREEPLAMVSVMACEGSAPRGPGTRMLVAQGRAWGTIGGGALEFQAIEQAHRALELPSGAWRIQDYPLGPLLGQCCGGRVRLLVEHLDSQTLAPLQGMVEGALLVSHFSAARIDRHWTVDGQPSALSARGIKPEAGARIVEPVGQWRRPIYLFGAGHVGQAIARHSPGLPLRLCWFDTRPMFESIDGVTVVPEDEILGCVEEAPRDAAIVILTHDHALDYRLARAALRRPAGGFVGLIGSATKRARFVSRLGADGVDVRGLTCPIGVSGIGGKEPDVIAIAVLAQLLQLPMMQSPVLQSPADAAATTEKVSTLG